MARRTVQARRKCWAYSAGSRGRNRVRAFRHPKTGTLYLEWRVPVHGTKGRINRQPLVGLSQDEAKQAADRMAVELLAGAVSVPFGPVTIGALFDMYLRGADPARSTRQHNERAAQLFIQCWGTDRLATSLSPATVEEYLRKRKSGQLAPHGRQGKPVRNRVLEEDFTFLRTVIRWATRKRKDESGRWLLEVDPLGDAVVVPREKDPHRPTLSDAEVAVMLAKARETDSRIWLAMQLCHATGRRLNSVRQLRWSDIDLEHHTIKWRGEHQKNGETRVTPIPLELSGLLREVRLKQAAIGGGLLFPSRNPSVAINRSVFHNGWRKVRRLCGLPERRDGFHAFRRRLASDLASAPLAVVAELGGWKHPDVALKVYQQPNLDQQRSILESRQRYRKGA